jgi:hypothetical protein
MNSDGLFPRGPVTKLATTMLTGIGLLSASAGHRTRFRRR